MENSMIQKNTVYFNTRPLFEAKKKLIFLKFSIILAKKGGGGGGSDWLWSFLYFFFNEGFPNLFTTT